MNAPLRVAVLSGGFSAESEVSRVSGTRAAEALVRLGYAVSHIECDRTLVTRLETLRPDVVFNALHGTWGEDGRIQALCDWLHLRYTGSDVLGCALSFDKDATKHIYTAHGLPTPAWLRFEPSMVKAEDILRVLALPLVLKPLREGSSKGVHVVRDAAALHAALHELRAANCASALAEAYIAGREFTIAVLGAGALPVIEIMTAAGHAFYSYAAKYTAGQSRHIVPAAIAAELTEQLQSLALQAHQALGLRDYSRTDILLGAGDEPLLLETNALPGLTPVSLLPDAAAAAGISYDRLIERILQPALARSPVPR